VAECNVINLQGRNKRIKRVRITGRQTDLDSNGVLPVYKHTKRMLRQTASWSLNKAQKDTAVCSGQQIGLHAAPTVR